MSRHEIRKRYLDVFVYGNWVQVDAPSEEVFAFTCQYENQKALVVCNFTSNNLDWYAGSMELHRDPGSAFE